MHQFVTEQYWYQQYYYSSTYLLVSICYRAIVWVRVVRKVFVVGALRGQLRLQLASSWIYSIYYDTILHYVLQHTILQHNIYVTIL